jgi:hypothetical protein
VVDLFILQKAVCRKKREDGLRIARVKLSADLMVDKNSLRRWIICIYYRCTKGARQEKKPPKSGGSAAREGDILVVASVVTMIAVAVIISILLGTRMVLRHIDILVPFVAHEIDGVAAGIISVAVTAPVLRMAGRDSQVDRLSNDNGRRPNHDGSRVDDFRLGKASDVYAAVKARLADADGHTHVGGICRSGNKSDHDGKQNAFHVRFLSLGFIFLAFSTIDVELLYGKTAEAAFGLQPRQISWNERSHADVDIFRRHIIYSMSLGCRMLMAASGNH